MPNESREARADTLQVLMPWGMPASADPRDGLLAEAGLWLTGGVSLLLWTALALLLTSA